LAYSVEKLEELQQTLEFCKPLDLERFRSFITSTAPVESLRIQLQSEGTMILSKLSHPKCIDHRYYNFVERIEPLRIIGERRETIGLSKALMELPNRT
jgi:hypothetical protein